MSFTIKCDRCYTEYCCKNMPKIIECDGCLTEGCEICLDLETCIGCGKDFCSNCITVGVCGNCIERQLKYSEG